MPQNGQVAGKSLFLKVEQNKMSVSVQSWCFVLLRAPGCGIQRKIHEVNPKELPGGSNLWMMYLKLIKYNPLLDNFSLA